LTERKTYLDFYLIANNFVRQALDGKEKSSKKEKRKEKEVNFSFNPSWAKIGGVLKH